MYKLIQINVQGYAHFEDLCEFLKNENPDIINIQETMYGDVWSDKGERRDFLGELASILGLDYYVDYLTVGRQYPDHNGWLGVAVLSRYPIVDYRKSILNGSEPQAYPHDYGMFVLKEKYDKYKYAFRLPLGCLTTLIDLDGTLVRNITAHFHVSYECTETENHITDAEHVVQILQNSKELPTIFSADMNIRTGTASVDMIAAHLTHHTNTGENTLSKKYHPIFEKHENHPGLGIDHVFSSGVSDPLAEILHEEVSDHYPVRFSFGI